MTQDPTLLSILALAIFQGGKTLREWMRDKRRHRELVEQNDEAIAQASSANRKVAALVDRLEEKGVLTPNPTRLPRRSTEDPVTIHGMRNPLLSREEPTNPGRGQKK